MALAQRLAGELGSDESGPHYDHSHQSSISSLDFMLPPDSQTQPKRGILQFSAGYSDKEPARRGLGLIPGGGLGDVRVSKEVFNTCGFFYKLLSLKR